jgi:hypothetical protein
VIDTLSGHAAAAVQALQQALAKGYSAEVAKHDPELTPLHGDPEFQRLVTTFGRKRN